MFWPAKPHCWNYFKSFKELSKPTYTLFDDLANGKKWIWMMRSDILGLGAASFSSKKLLRLKKKTICRKLANEKWQKVSLALSSIIISREKNLSQSSANELLSASKKIIRENKSFSFYFFVLNQFLRLLTRKVY